MLTRKRETGLLLYEKLHKVAHRELTRALLKEHKSLIHLPMRLLECGNLPLRRCRMPFQFLDIRFKLFNYSIDVMFLRPMSRETGSIFSADLLFRRNLLQFRLKKYENTTQSFRKPTGLTTQSLTAGFRCFFLPCFEWDRASSARKLSVASC